MFNSRRAFKVFFAILVVFTVTVFAISVYANYLMYKECRNDGHKAYECQSMLQGPRYYHLDMNQP